jgi:hypothetical protein
MFRPSITAFLSLGVFMCFFIYLSLAHSDLTMKQGSPLRTKRICVIQYKDSVCSAQKTLSASVIKTSLLIVHKAKVTVCSEIHTKHINAM